VRHAEQARRVNLGPGHAIEVDVAGKQRCLMPPGGGGDHAASQARWRDTGLPASAVDARGALEVGGCVELVQVEPQQKAAQVRFLSSGPA